MMNRTELKANAKAAFKKSYWKCVGAALLLSVTVASVCGGNTHFNIGGHVFDTHTASVAAGFALAATGISLVAAMLIRFVLAPFEVGCKGYFLKNRKEDAKFGECLSGFKGNFKNTAFIMLVRDIKIALWSLLFVVPGIVKAYEYKMVPYLLSEDPDMKMSEAFRTSKEMMSGHKMDAFVLDLSFLGWDLLGVVTCGLAEVFYVMPYKVSTGAEFYESLKAAA